MLTGLSSVSKTLEAILASVRTQHALSTEVIEILGEEKAEAARSLTYFTATHFGVGAYYGQVGVSIELIDFFYLFIYPSFVLLLWF